MAPREGLAAQEWTPIFCEQTFRAYRRPKKNKHAVPDFTDDLCPQFADDPMSPIVARWPDGFTYVIQTVTVEDLARQAEGKARVSAKRLKKSKRLHGGDVKAPGKRKKGKKRIKRGANNHRQTLPARLFRGTGCRMMADTPK